MKSLKCGKQIWNKWYNQDNQGFLKTGGKTGQRLKQKMAKRSKGVSEPEPAEPEPIAKRTRSNSGSEPEGVKKTIKKKKKKKKRTVQ